MKNLKKSLAITLIAIMVFSMSVLGAVPTPNLVLSLDFENDSGYVLNDISGAGNHAEFMCVYGLGMRFIESPFGQGLLLDGASQFFEVSEAVFDRDELTFAFWTRWEGGAVWQRVFELGSWIQGDHVMMVPRTGDGLFQFSAWNAELQVAVTANPVDTYWTLPLNEWVHIAVTQNADNIATIYINGEPLAVNLGIWDGGVAEFTTVEDTTEIPHISFSYANNPPAEGVDIFRRIGWAATSAWDATFAGAFDEVRVFDGVLTSAQIMALVQHNNHLHEYEVETDGQNLTLIIIIIVAASTVLGIVLPFVLLKSKKKAG